MNAWTGPFEVRRRELSSLSYVVSGATLVSLRGMQLTEAITSAAR